MQKNVYSANLTSDIVNIQADYCLYQEIRVFVVLLVHVIVQLVLNLCNKIKGALKLIMSLAFSWASIDKANNIPLDKGPAGIVGVIVEIGFKWDAVAVHDLSFSQCWFIVLLSVWFHVGFMLI